MNASEQKVYVGNKLYLRTVWSLRKDANGTKKGLVRFAGKVLTVMWVGDPVMGHWATHDNG